MVSKKLSILLIRLLFAFVLFKHFLEHTHQVATAVGATSVNQELPDEVVVAPLRDLWIKGRKMVVEKELRKVGGVNGGSTEISGMAKNASKRFGISQDGRNVQGYKILKPKPSDPTNMETTGSSSHSPEDQEPSSSEASVSQEPYEIYPKVESQRLLEDAIEAMGMLSMDYKNPHRKPPISNDQPANDHEKDKKP